MNIEHQVSLSHWGVFIEILDPVYCTVYGRDAYGHRTMDNLKTHKIIGYRPLNSFDDCEYESKFKNIERIVT